MKKYCILCLFLIGAFSLRAQIVGDVSITRKVLCEQGGKLHLELDIRVSRNAVTRSQSWAIVPELSTADRRSVKLFPHVQIDGPYQRHMRKRRRVLTGEYWAERQPYMIVDANRRADQLVRYVMDVPYEAWMAGATLVVRQVLTSPGSQRRVFSVDVNGAVDVAQ